VHLAYPISDAIGGLFGALGVVSALLRLARHPEEAGQDIDCAVTEAMLRVLEFLPIEYDQLGVVRARSGNRSQYAAPGNVYRTRDGRWASIAASTQSIFLRLCKALGPGASARGSTFCQTTRRGWRIARRSTRSCRGLSARWICRNCAIGWWPTRLGFSPIQDIADVFADPQIQARQAIVPVPDPELGEVRMQAVVPRFSATPGEVRRAGPRSASTTTRSGAKSA
jgi:crotonobetainyl-CoA:carnitine CoA-transferase CaiB-like acyl-CoA transferase